MDIYVAEVDCYIGLGVFAKRAFQKGEVVLTGRGPVSSEQTMFTIQIDWDCHMDLPAPSKFLNHACEPNVGVQQCNENGVVFIALRDIRKDEELTFDYAMTEYMHYPRSDPSQEFELTCRCKSPTCRGRLGYYSELDAELRQKYEGLVAGYLLTIPKHLQVSPYVQVLNGGVLNERSK